MFPSSLLINRVPNPLAVLQPLHSQGCTGEAGEPSEADRSNYRSAGAAGTTFDIVRGARMKIMPVMGGEGDREEMRE
jgi:hypothetical protein